MWSRVLDHINRRARFIKIVKYLPRLWICFSFFFPSLFLLIQSDFCHRCCCCCYCLLLVVLRMCCVQHATAVIQLYSRIAYFWWREKQKKNKKYTLRQHSILPFASYFHIRNKLMRGIAATVAVAYLLVSCGSLFDAMCFRLLCFHTTFRNTYTCRVNEMRNKWKKKNNRNKLYRMM